MSHSNPGLGGTSGYQVRTKGRISDRLADLFEGMTLVQEVGGTTLICCPDIDQAGLHGVLARVRDLGLPLISVTRLGPECNRKELPL